MNRIDNDLGRALEMARDIPPIMPETVRDAIKANLPDAIEMGYYVSGEAIAGNDDLIIELAGHGPMIEVRVKYDDIYKQYKDEFGTGAGIDHG